jgi:hypothetical protein
MNKEELLMQEAAKAYAWSVGDEVIEPKIEENKGQQILNEDKNEEIEKAKMDCNRPKSELIKIWRKISEINPVKAEKLDKIIGELEAWQNTK